MSVTDSHLDPALIERLASPTDAEVAALEAWWRANNHLTVGQIYLMSNRDWTFGS